MSQPYDPILTEYDVEVIRNDDETWTLRFRKQFYVVDEEEFQSRDEEPSLTLQLTAEEASMMGLPGSIYMAESDESTLKYSEEFLNLDLPDRVRKHFESLPPYETWEEETW
jgi:hypothetical protein